MSQDVKVKLPHVEVPERVVEIWTRKEEFVSLYLESFI